MPDAVDPEVVAHMERFYLRQIDRIASRLRASADNIERHKKIMPNNRDGLPDYAESLQAVIHEFQTMLGNLPLDSLTSAANSAHVYARVGEIAPS